MLQFFLTDRQIDRQTDRVITIGHSPNGGALIIITRGPKAHILAPEYNVPPLLTGRLSCFSDLLKNIYSVEDIEILLPVKFR